MDFRITLTGTQPLLMHNVRLANPVDPLTQAFKRVSAKRIKTDTDYEEMAWLEFVGSLYFDADLGPYVPGLNIERCLRDGGTVTKSGKDVQKAVFVSTDVNPLVWPSRRDTVVSPEELFKDPAFVHVAPARVGQARIMRTRPVFAQWEVVADGMVDLNLMSMDKLQQIAEVAGSQFGLGDWRPRFGRFTATVEPR